MTDTRAPGATRNPSADRSATVTRTPPSVWWLSPVTVSLFVSVTSVVLTFMITDEQFRDLWRSPKSFTVETGLLFLAAGLALAFGATVVGAVRTRSLVTSTWPNLSPDAVSVLRKASLVLTVLTVLGYVGFVVLILRAGIGFEQLFVSAADPAGVPLKDAVGTLPGITTMTQFGLAAVVISSLLLAQRFSRGELIKLLVVVGLAIPRAFAFSERLALLELLVPMIAVFFMSLAARRRARTLINWLPLFAIPAVGVVFALFEYFRSWEFYRTTGKTNFAEFATERIAGYYATALNNGHLSMEHVPTSGRLPYGTVEFFWMLPGAEEAGFYERLSDMPPPTSYSQYASMLEQFGNPEFNNGSGYAEAFLDYGTWGGLSYFLIAGMVAGFLYHGFRSSSPAGLLYYPIVFVGLLELPRYLHWAQGRAFPSLVALGVVVMLLRRHPAPSSNRRIHVGSTAPPGRSPAISRP